MRPVFSNLQTMGYDPVSAAHRESFTVLSGTKLVLADLNAVRADMMHVAGGWQPTDATLLTWLTNAGSVLSQSNVKPNDVNGAPRTSGARHIGLRPPRYGRAAIFDATLRGADANAPNTGLALDIKGCGVSPDRVPSRVRRGSGTLLLHEALQEVLNSRLLQRIFAHAGLDVACLPIYALVDLGITGWCSYFDTRMPCVTLLRRAHLRPVDNDEIPAAGSVEEQAKHRIELVLRRYGMSSAPMSCSLDFVGQGDDLHLIKNGEVIDGVPAALIARHMSQTGLTSPCNVRLSNVQMTAGCAVDPLQATLVDFGHYTAEPQYSGHHLLTLVNDKPFNWGSFLRESDPGWVQPDTSCCVAQSLVGPVAYPQELAAKLGYTLALHRLRPGVELEAVRLAFEISLGRLGSEDINQALDQFADDAVPWTVPSNRSTASNKASRAAAR